MRDKQSGRSMIEMLGVLAIIGVLSAGGIAGYSTAMESHKVNKFMEIASFGGAMGATMTSKFQQGGYSSIYVNDLCQLNVLGGEICNKKVADWDEKYRQGPFGEKLLLVEVIGGTNSFCEYDIMAADESGTITLYCPYTYFRIEVLSKIPVSACAKILSHQGWNEMGEFTNIEHPKLQELPLPPSKALALCQKKSDSYSSGRFLVLNIFSQISQIEFSE